uniref:AlNc14C126G6818 protein n=1 Tax=Albugo laibachii Nc14 TaxID=890382 RepID=F0WJU8_9STRA|nr:AlNc14C126G6818 [Albugo laibachii Nc14]|eukprot:CCA21550.1 AlNc14C126G6818 [Albugo laibachii Nc14]
MPRTTNAQENFPSIDDESLPVSRRISITTNDLTRLPISFATSKKINYELCLIENVSQAQHVVKTETLSYINTLSCALEFTLVHKRNKVVCRG